MVSKCGAEIQQAIQNAVDEYGYFGNCCGMSEWVASHIVSAFNPRVVYGCYLGQDCTGKDFWGDSFYYHAWIVFPDGSILDPTAQQFPDYSVVGDWNGKTKQYFSQEWADRAEAVRKEYNVPEGPRYLEPDHPMQMLYLFNKKEWWGDKVAKLTPERLQTFETICKNVRHEVLLEGLGEEEEDVDEGTREIELLYNRLTS